MKKIFYVPLVLLICGCMTANQLEAEKAYYEAMSKFQEQRLAVPAFEMVPSDADKPIQLINVGKFIVYNSPANNAPPMQQYQHKDYVQPWLNVLSMAVPWFGAWGIVHSTANAMKDMGNSTTQTISGTGNTGGIAPTHNVVSGTGNYGAGTSTPTVVPQPSPVIVTPVIVP
jgi:hypothetical protein